MKTPSILCSISTRGRYDTTLPLAINSVIMQTRRPDKLVIFDDNDSPRDLRENQTYAYLFQMLSISGIDWEFVFAERKGQHYNHQRANYMGYEWVWRLDDDTVAEPDTLEKLAAHIADDVGAIGGSVLTPPFNRLTVEPTGLIGNIDSEPNTQWDYIKNTREVDHLHCSFLYRAGVYDYDLSLSRVAHREETLFTYGLKQRGYKILVAPAVTWHLRNNQGGIRDGQMEMFAHDERIFQSKLNNTVVVLDCGMGDHIVFKHVLPEIKNPVIYSCYPDIVPGKSIAEARALFGDLMHYNIYAWMDRNNWKYSLESAFRKFYTGVEPI